MPFLGDHNMHLRRSKTRILEGCATKLGSGDLYIWSHMKEEKGRQTAYSGKGSRQDMAHKGRGGLGGEGVFDESHEADVRDGCETSCQLSQT